MTMGASFCPNCGVSVQPGGHFCANCGLPLATTPAATHPIPENPPPSLPPDQWAAPGFDRGRERRLNIVERYDWVVWVVLSVFGVMLGVSDMLTGGPTFASGEAVLFEGITGMTWDELQAAEPGAARFIDYQVRSTGGWIVFSGLLTIAIAVLGLRRGQRWAWLTMWLLGPLSLVLSLIVLSSTQRDPGAGVPVPLTGQVIFLIITVGLLLLTYRKYNPSR
jgi:hypothetical protein